jgi:hypothetical protein
MLGGHLGPSEVEEGGDRLAGTSSTILGGKRPLAVGLAFVRCSRPGVLCLVSGVQASSGCKQVQVACEKERAHSIRALITSQLGRSQPAAQGPTGYPPFGAVSANDRGLYR